MHGTAQASSQQLPTRAMTAFDIDNVIDAFAESAAAAYSIGFDGVNIHGAHGYLIDEFLWSETNLREDSYNGDILSRTRFAVELVQEVRRRTSQEFTIMFRFSQWKASRYDAKLVETPQALEQLLLPLVDAGVDIFDAYTRRFWLPEFADSNLNLAGWAKKISGLPTMTVGSVSLESPRRESPASKEATPRVALENITAVCEMLDRGDFDLVGIGRTLLANPSWCKLVSDNVYTELRPYHPEMLSALECSDYQLSRL